MYALQDDGKTHVVTVEGCTFVNNHATVGSKNIGGGAIAVTKSITVNIIGGKFIGNSSAYYGGAISVGKATSSGTGDTNANISISGGTFFADNKGTTGSVLWFKVSGTISVDTITVQDNTGATNGVVYIGENAVLNVSGVEDQDVYVGIRPEGFEPAADGAFSCALSNVEVMGRDSSVVATHPASVNPVVRAIINSDIKIDPSESTVRFNVKSHKLFLFNKETETRIYFEVK